MKIPSNLYLGGGAFGCIYHIGIVKALYEANINDLVIYGNSAGAIIAVFYILQVPADEISRVFSNIVDNATIQILTKPAEITSYQLTQHHLSVFDVIHKHSPDAYKKCSGKLKIGVTLDKTGFQWKDTFTSQTDFFNTLLCSFNVPYLCNYDAKIGGVKCIDGGFGFVMSRDLPKDTFKVTLHDNNESDLDADIPLIHRALPPPKAYWNQYLQNGYNDMKYRIDNGKVKLRPFYIKGLSFDELIGANNIQMWLRELQEITGGIYGYSTLVERYPTQM
jgi:hypothetical protein